MTQEQRFNLCLHMIDQLNPYELRRVIEKLEALAPEEAKRDAIIELCEGEDCFVANRMLESHAKGYREGHNEAIERAAEIAEKYESTVDWDIAVSFGIAQAIRAESEKV